MHALKVSSIGPPSSIRDLIPRVAVGQSFSVVRPLVPGDGQAGTKLTRLISSTVTQTGCGYKFEYESFTALTSRQLPVVGCVATRVS